MEVLHYAILVRIVHLFKLYILLANFEHFCQNPAHFCCTVEACSKAVTEETAKSTLISVYDVEIVGRTL